MIDGHWEGDVWVKRPERLSLVERLAVAWIVGSVLMLVGLFGVLVGQVVAWWL